MVRTGQSKALGWHLPECLSMLAQANGLARSLLEFLIDPLQGFTQRMGAWGFLQSLLGLIAFLFAGFFWISHVLNASAG